MNAETPLRRVVRVRHELRRREIEVVAVESLSPGLLSVTFGGEALADFISSSFDDHLKFFVPEASGETVGRDYTPRRYSNAEQRLVIEFAMHGDGSADRWARQAAVGQRVTIGGPRGSMIVPLDYDFHLLVGDVSALPAMSRRLEELPRDAVGYVVVQAAPADQRALLAPPGVAVRWVASADEALAAVREWPVPAGEVYAWAAGEATEMAAMRRVLIEEKKIPKETMRVAAYWKRGASGHHENLGE